jgi:hypothetical protein
VSRSTETKAAQACMKALDVSIEHFFPPHTAQKNLRLNIWFEH